MDSSETKLLQIESLVTLDDEINIPFHILAKYPRLRVFTNLADIHFYILSPNTLGLLSQLRTYQLETSREIMVSFREEFIPWLVSRQYFERNFNLDDEELVVLGDNEATISEGSEQYSFMLEDLECMVEDSYSSLVNYQQEETTSYKCSAFITDAQIPDFNTYAPPLRVNTITSFSEANRQVCICFFPFRPLNLFLLHLEFLPIARLG